MNINHLNIYRNNSSRLAAAMASLLLLVAGGCVMDNEDCPVVDPDDGIVVTFELSGGIPAHTRVLEEEEGSEEESYIDINDLYIFTFEIGEGKTVADGDSKLMEILWSPNEDERLDRSFITSSAGNAIWLRTFLNSNPNGNGTDPYKNDDGTYKNFCIVTVANASKWLDGGATSSGFIKGTTTLAALQKTLSYSKVLKNGSWVPGGKENPSWMPLFGIKRVKLDGYDPKTYNESNPYPLGTVWLLRALAKVEITTGADSGLTIESANVVGGGWNKDLSLIPFDSSTPKSLNCMENYAETGSTGQMARVPTFTSTAAGESETLSFSTEGNKAVVYLPEYNLQNNRIVSIKFKELPDYFPLNVSPYDANGNPVSGEDIWWKFILRNYLYRFNINGVTNNPLTLQINYTVCPMMTYETDIPEFQ